MNKAVFSLITMIFFSVFSYAQKSSLGFTVDAEIQKLESNQELDLVIFSSDDAIQDEFSKIGITYFQYSRNYYRAKVNQDQAKELYNFKHIEYVEPLLNRAALLNDTMVYNNRVHGLHQGLPPLKSSYSGNGVVIGFIDSGVDFTHPDLQDTSGNTRVIKIWDQTADTLTSSRIPRFNYGQEWDSTDINAGNCPHDDDVLSHGTNVVGIAAGNGNALNKFKGVAPEADIMMVATDFNASNWLENAADAVEYIFEEAEALGKSCVINISAGVYLGSHDGSDLAAIRIDSMIKAKRGRAVVAACGNAGSINFHLGYDIDSDTSFTWFEYNPSSSLGNGAVYYQLWSDTADFDSVQFSFGVNLPSPSFQFRTQSPFVNISSRLNAVVADTLKVGGNVLGVVETNAQLMGDKYFLEVKIDQPDSNQYLFSLITTGDGKLDVWSDTWLGTSHIYNDSLPSSSLIPGIQHYERPDTFQTMVSSFTCLPSVITVGNYNNRDAYVDFNGTTQMFNVIPGKKADNSSLGPNRRGLQKPDVIASGDYTLTANRLASIPLHIANGQADRIAQGGFHKRNGGTSMAAPVVSGVVALMLEECSDLDYETIKSSLTQNTYSDTLTGNLPNFAYGYGKVDAEEALKDLYFNSNISPAGLIEVCEFDVVELSGPIGMTSYQWSTGDTSRQISIDSAGFYTLIATDSGSCVGMMESVELRKWTNPVKPTISVIDDNTLESSPALKYLWYLNGFPMTTETNQQLKIYFGGHFSVEVADANDCKTHSDSLQSYLLLPEFKGVEEIRLFPNPSSDGLHYIKCSSCLNESKLRLEILDLNGKLVLEKNLDQDLRFQLDQKGLYQYRIIGDTEILSTGKVMYY